MGFQFAIGVAVEDQNNTEGKKDNVVFLDGDILRLVYTSGGYSTEERKRLAYQDCRMCRMLSEQNIDVVYCGISMYEEC